MQPLLSTTQSSVQLCSYMQKSCMFGTFTSRRHSTKSYLMQQQNNKNESKRVPAAALA
jgi:hypothetical protein